MCDFYVHWIARFIVLSLHAKLNLECDFFQKKRDHSAERTSKQQLSTYLLHIANNYKPQKLELK